MLLTSAQYSAARALLGLSQPELSALTKLSRPTITRLERGVGSPSAKTAERAAQAYATLGIVFKQGGVCLKAGNDILSDEKLPLIFALVRNSGGVEHSSISPTIRGVYERYLTVDPTKPVRIPVSRLASEIRRIESEGLHLIGIDITNYEVIGPKGGQHAG